MNIDEAAHALWELFYGNCPGIHPYIQSIGVGAGEIHVYLARKVRSHEYQIPANWHGFPVRTRVVGRIRIGAPQD